MIANQISKDITSLEYAEQTNDNNYKMIADGVSVHFNKKPAIRDISMKFKSKTITAIIGPSGCGKTVFICSLNLMHSLTKSAKVEGRVFLDKVMHS